MRHLSQANLATNSRARPRVSTFTFASLTAIPS